VKIEILCPALEAILKSFKSNTPKIIPPNSETNTLRVYRARNIAKSEGSKVSGESSMYLYLELVS
jgi:hypothetical protein